jgi:hypothetical protein
MGLADNIWWTRKAKIRAEKRLLAHAFHSQLLLLWYSFFGVVVSIYYLKFEATGANGDLAGITWVVYSVLVLVMSGFIAGLSFKERANLIKECYEALQVLYEKTKSNNPDYSAIADEYQKTLGLCENHSEYDYYQALCLEHLTSTASVDQKTKIKHGLDRRPAIYHWISLSWWVFRHYLFLFLMYSLPMIIAVYLKLL